jgi:hypothetical protein
MKNLIGILIFAVVFSSCSNDDTTNNNTGTPVGTVLFSYDSLGVVVNIPNSSSLQVQAFTQTIQASQVRVEYLLQSNGDTSFCYARYQDTTNGTPQRPGEQLVISGLDSAFNYLLDVPAQPFFIEFRVRLFTLQNASMPYYIKFRNIRVTKTQ